jgi:hypothetical protein
MEGDRLSDRLRLVLLSALMLFVELSLIRWLGSNVVYLSYFSNFVLLGSFLGIGLGFLRGNARVETFRFAPVALAFFVGLVLIFPVEIDRRSEDLLYFGTLEASSGFPLWVTLPFIFVAVAAVMMMIAEGVARAFVRFAPLEAYRLDIGGSILGIIAFSALSFTWAPPVAWGAAVALFFLILLPRPVRLLQLVALAGLVLMLGRESMVPQFSWSPYYKGCNRLGPRPPRHNPDPGQRHSASDDDHHRGAASRDARLFPPVRAHAYASWRSTHRRRGKRD